MRVSEFDINFPQCKAEIGGATRIGERLRGSLSPCRRANANQRAPRCKALARPGPCFAASKGASNCEGPGLRDSPQAANAWLNFGRR
jgi:hypothetical protein